MPVSMSTSGAYASPSQRASVDDARMKARMQRTGLTPAPGAYDPKRQGSTSEDLAGSTAFKSKSNRRDDGMLREQGDPGAYEPYSHMTVSNQSSRSFNKSQQLGSGGFGSKMKRPELSSPTEAPGPGTYDAKLPSSPEAKQGSAFASQTKRGGYLSKVQTPGSGEYEPSAQDKINGGDSMFKNKDQRFKKSIEVEYSAHVAPGSYSHEGHTIEKRYRQNRGKVSSAFASTSLRGDMFMGHRC
eukprot:CAMPEP_0115844762 /NCGR_PEP_ID=MMETSP0287-20121206/8994_1 /TAXON_ID=412157 /ORGANISM="Chrysochromulina rotalis, Strain UIO044" /LENGTH=241 /DNA_ID=CAMNT_0003298495 /DNA_START=9 /DNA_END=734 /DNA_ORIENTATION=+